MNLPETITLLPDKPSWEIILTTTKGRRNPDAITVHGALFDSLWSESGLNQNSPSEMFKIIVKKAQGASHEFICDQIADWAWHILNTKSIKGVRFSSGKYTDEEGTPFYDNKVDVDVSMVLEGSKKEPLIILVDKMLGYERRYKKFKEIHYVNRAGITHNGKNEDSAQRKRER